MTIWRSVRSAGWGLGMAASVWSNNATYATVSNTESWGWQTPIVGEVWLHEWLHGVCAYFAGQGYLMPDGDADSAALIIPPTLQLTSPRIWVRRDD